MNWKWIQVQVQCIYYMGLQTDAKHDAKNEIKKQAIYEQLKLKQTKSKTGKPKTKLKKQNNPRNKGLANGRHGTLSITKDRKNKGLNT